LVTLEPLTGPQSQPRRVVGQVSMPTAPRATCCCAGTSAVHPSPQTSQSQLAAGCAHSRRSQTCQWLVAGPPHWVGLRLACRICFQHERQVTSTAPLLSAAADVPPFLHCQRLLTPKLSLSSPPRPLRNFTSVLLPWRCTSTFAIMPFPHSQLDTSAERIWQGDLTNVFH